MIIDELGERTTVALGPGEARYVSVYEPWISQFGNKPRTTVSFVWCTTLPWTWVVALNPRRDYVTARWFWPPIEVGVRDVERLVRELARYDARNLKRDRFLIDQGFEIDIVLGRYRFGPKGGPCLVLNALRLPW